MVPEYQMPSGVFTAAAIVGWWYVGPDMLEDVTISEEWWRAQWSL
jgi:hypothetical protein